MLDVRGGLRMVWTMEARPTLPPARSGAIQGSSLLATTTTAGTLMIRMVEFGASEWTVLPTGNTAMFPSVKVNNHCRTNLFPDKNLLHIIF